MNLLQNFKNELQKKIQEDLNPSIIDKHYFTSNFDKIYQEKLMGLIKLQGFYFEHPLGNKENAIKLVSELEDYEKFIIGIIQESDWTNYKVFILTPFQISEISKLNLSKFDISHMQFGFLSIFPNFDKNDFKLQNDNGMVTKNVSDKLYEAFTSL